MEPVLHAVGFIVTSAIVLLVVAFVIADAAARLEFIRDKLPGLQRWLEKRNSVVYLLVVAIFLQVGFLSEFMLRDMPEVPVFRPPAFATIPAPIIQQQDRPAAVPMLRHELSLRDRAIKLAKELQAFTDQRDKHFPPLYENGPMTPEQVQLATAPQFNYRQETDKLYDQRFSVRVVTVVAEFKALGLDVSPIENCAAAGMCSPTPIPVELHALAARLDDNGNVRR
jgi:hypothetical protein